jgi:hypothetical protein
VQVTGPCRGAHLQSQNANADEVGVRLAPSFVGETIEMFGTRIATGVMILALASPAIAPTDLLAQDAKTDSLEARIRELEARLDSLLAALARGAGPDSAAAAAASELDALRAAAQAAAGEQETDTTQGSRSRDLSILNPEISVTGDVLGTYTAPPDGNNFFSAVPREFEFAFEAAVDPYARTKIFISHEQDFEIVGLPESGEEEEGGGGEVGIEEGYIYWTALPANMGIKVGVFRQDIGLYNRWHTHALFEVDRPLPTVAFLGEDGLIQTGGSLVLPFFEVGPTTNLFTVELTRGSNEALFEGGKQLSLLGNFRNFWNISDATYMQIGATGVYGKNDDENLNTYLLGIDVAFRWRPPGRSLYRDLQLKAEWYFAKKDFGPEDFSGNGGYLQANYRLDRRWIAGLRTDYVDGYGSGPDVFMLVPTITWWQSEWVRLRLQYNLAKTEGQNAGHTFILQTVWAIGPHRHEVY